VIFELDRLYVLDTRSGRFAFPGLNLAAPVHDVEFSPDDNLMVTSVSDEGMHPRFAQLWDTATGKRMGRPFWHDDGVLHGSFSHDGTRVVTASEDYKAVIWDAKTGEPVAPPLTHQGQVWDASFSGDDRWVATASQDGTARVWDARSGEPLTPPLSHSRDVRKAALLDEPLRVVTVTGDGRAWLWELPADTHSTAELELLTELLLGDPRGAKGRTPQEKVRELEGAWRTLKAAHPDDSVVTKSQRVAWHEHEARLAEEDGQIEALEFHHRWLKANAR
jgi:WD40 repeat protein